MLAQRIRELVPRGEAAKLSAMAGMSAETFSSWRTGKRVPNPDLRELERLADALRVSPAYLISEEMATAAGFDFAALRRLLQRFEAIGEDARAVAARLPQGETSALAVQPLLRRRNGPF